MFTPAVYPRLFENSDHVDISKNCAEITLCQQHLRPSQTKKETGKARGPRAISNLS